MKVYILIGLLGSGKSTESKRLASLNDSFIINVDSLRQMLYGKYNFIQEDENIIETLFNRILFQLLIKSDKDIIIDESNYILTKQSRKQLVETILEIKNTEIIYVICPDQEKNLERRLEKNKGLSDDIWISVNERMKNEYEEITEEECSELKVKKQFKVDLDITR
jgi:tRNA uridine 5-carbamoylmethylation protein Kti12